jgi:hypothetical protein
MYVLPPPCPDCGQPRFPDEVTRAITHYARLGLDVTDEPPDDPAELREMMDHADMCGLHVRTGGGIGIGCLAV